MDYKYIEQLVERYFQCETTLQEEQILHSFFAQDEQEVPEALRQWRPLFAALQMEEPTLGSDFDERVLAITEQQAPVVKAHVVSLNERLRPLYKAAAIVAVVLTLGQAMNLSLQRGQSQGDDINYANYKDTYDDPAVAYDQVEDALQLLSEGYTQARQTDSLMSIKGAPVADSLRLE